MIYILFISLIVLFMMSYALSGRDFFAPSTVQLLTFAGTVFMCIFFMWSMNAPYEFHWKTIGIIMSAMALTTVLGIAVHHLFRKIKIHSLTSKSAYATPISPMICFLCIGVIICTIIWQLAEIRRIGGSTGSFVKIMHDFHAVNSYSTDEAGRLPWILRQLLALMQVIFLIFSFNLIRFFNVLTFYQKCINFGLLGLCCISLLLMGGRTSVINLLISCFIIFHLLRIQKEGKYTQYNFKFLFRIALLLIGIMAGFFLTKSFVGRNGINETMNPINYLAYYTGTQYIALDQYLQEPLGVNTIWGKETFYAMIQFLIKYLSIDIPEYIVHLEFRPVGSGFASNVYTFLRVYHHDFGIAGMYVLHSISILFLSVFYEYVKKRRGNLGILIFGQIYYTIVMSFYTERFFSNIFSVNYIKQLVMLIALYEFFIKMRIRFAFTERHVGADKFATIQKLVKDTGKST